MSHSGEEGGAGEERHGGEGRAGQMSDRAREGLKRSSERARVLASRSLGERVSLEASWMHISQGRLFNWQQNPGIDMIGARLAYRL